MPAGTRWRQVALGLDGAWALILSNLILVASAGLSLLPLLRQVRRTASETAINAPASGLLMVLGHGLQNDRLSDEYRQRLARARELFGAGAAQRLLLVGGRTRDNRLTEAEAGRDHLLQLGVPAAAIHLEDTSRHTLENLHRARAQYELRGVNFILISSRYHLARCDTLARGLSLEPVLCAAEDQRDSRRWPAELLEAYYLHWYHTGKHWSRLTRNRKSLARIS